MTCWEIRIEGEPWQWASADLAASAECFNPGKGMVRLADVPRSPAIAFLRQRRIRRIQRSDITARRLAAADRALKAEQLREGGPLFAHLVAATQPTPRQRCEHLDRIKEENISASRRQTAEQWWQGRRILATYAPDVRDLIVHAWNGCGYPKTADWFLLFLRKRGYPDLSVETQKGSHANR